VIFFSVPFVVVIVGWLIHVLVDGVPRRRTGYRVAELLLLWMMVFFGFWAAVGGVLHMSGLSGSLAEEIGYTQSMFQWEVGWADVAVGVLGMGCALPRFRGHWMTAAVVALAICYGGDAIGHIMEWIAHDNTADANTWAIPSDVIQPVAAIILLAVYRKGQRLEGAPAPT
jgi:hypothetical protein